MEAAGLALGAVSLVGMATVARDGQDLIDAYRYAGRDTKPFVMRHDATPLALQLWRESVGIRDDGSLEPGHHQQLDKPEVRGLVIRILQYLEGVVPDGNSKSKSKGQSSKSGASSRPKPFIDVDRYRESLSFRSKLKWTGRDKKRASDQMQTTDSLLQVLQSLTPPGEHPQPNALGTSLLLLCLPC